jgi:hypothetical protein
MAKPRKRTVTYPELGKVGRLGNHLFQIASTIGIAKSNNLDFAFPKWRCQRFFKNHLPHLNKHGRKQKRHRENRQGEFKQIKLSGDTDLYGYYQTEKYFSHCSGLVRKYFTPSKLSIPSKQILDIAEGACSIHVRHGDYIGTPNMRLLDMSYYNQAIEMFPSDTKFLICTDDLRWCNKMFTDKKFVITKSRCPTNDLFAMAACANHIIANSSFSWWAAWLNPNLDKKVIGPEKQHRPNCSMKEPVDWFLDDWIQI